MRWQPLDDADAVARAAGSRILAAARRAIEARGRFDIVLAGGTTPQQVYRLLREARDAGWEHWVVWFGDERCLPVDHAGRNSRMAGQTLLDHVPIPLDQRFPIPAERGAARAAEAYEALIRRARPFDLVLLGMGADGHTASLFPGRKLPPHRLVVPVFDAPKPPPERVSLTPRALCSTRELLVLVTGAAKRDAVRAWRHGADLPIARLPCETGMEVLIDRAAWPGEGV